MTDLYRFYDNIGTLLYVGITDRGPRRWREHMRDKPWWPEVSTIRLEAYEKRSDAQRAELEAIQCEDPVHNIQGANGPYRGHRWENLPQQPQSQADMAWRCEVCYRDLVRDVGLIQLLDEYWHVFCKEHALSSRVDITEYTTDIVTWYDLREWQMHCHSKYAPRNNASQFGGWWEEYSHGLIGFFDEVVCGAER